MGKVGDYKCCISNLNAHDVVDDTCPSDIAHIDEIIANPIFHRRFHNLPHKSVEIGIAKLHGDKSVASLKLAALFRLVLFPSFKSKADIHKHSVLVDSRWICHSDDTHPMQFFNELFSKFPTRCINGTLNLGSQKLIDGSSRLRYPVSDVSDEIHRLYCRIGEVVHGVFSLSGFAMFIRFHPLEHGLSRSVMTPPILSQVGASVAVSFGLHMLQDV